MWTLTDEVIILNPDEVDITFSNNVITHKKPKRDLLKKLILYLFRWQLSTPILYIVLHWLTNINTLISTIIANLIGGLIFFWVDKLIFKN